LPTAAFTANTPCFGEPVVFTGNSTSTVAWQWNFGDGVGSTLQNPTHTYATAGTYSVTLIMTNAQGCKDTI
jgi:PKD repeat protein